MQPNASTTPSSDCFGGSDSSDILQGGQAERTGSRQASPSSVYRWPRPKEMFRGHTANQGETAPASLPSPGLPTQLASLLCSTQKGAEKKNTENHFSPSARVSLPFPWSGWRPRSGSRVILPAPPGHHPWPRPESQKWAWHLPGLLHRVAGARNVLWSRHLLTRLDGLVRAVPSSRTRRCQREAEGMHLPGLERSVAVPGDVVVCLPLFFPGALST